MYKIALNVCVYVFVRMFSIQLAYN